jgi:hypothetical protein
MTNTIITQDGTQTIQTQGSFQFPQVQSGTPASAREELISRTTPRNTRINTELLRPERITIPDELIQIFIP